MLKSIHQLLKTFSIFGIEINSPTPIAFHAPNPELKLFNYFQSIERESNKTGILTELCF